mgnify:CR=1 FL=1
MTRRLYSLLVYCAVPFAFALVLYPFVDTTYAIFRRWRQGRPIMSPDAEHLHSLLGQKLSQAHPSRGRNIASVLIVVASAAFTCVATRWMTNTVVLVALSATYFVGYVVCHRCLASPATAARFQGNHESAD